MEPRGTTSCRHAERRTTFASLLSGMVVVLACVALPCALLLLGCGSTPGGGTGGGGSTDTTHFFYPRGADDLVLGITVGGGLIGPQASFTQLPMTTLTG